MPSPVVPPVKYKIASSAIVVWIGSVADEHYSFMGAADPVTMEKSAREVAKRMKLEGVDTVFLIPI